MLQSQVRNLLTITNGPEIETIEDHVTLKLDLRWGCDRKTCTDYNDYTFKLDPLYLSGGSSNIVAFLYTM